MREIFVTLLFFVLEITTAPSPFISTIILTDAPDAFAEYFIMPYISASDTGELISIRPFVALATTFPLAFMNVNVSPATACDAKKLAIAIPLLPRAANVPNLFSAI